MSVNIDLIHGLDKVKEYFSDFRPETRSMTINFSRKTCSIGLAIKAPSGFRKNHKKIQIPAYSGFRIINTQTSTFKKIDALWQNTGDAFVMNAKDLPSSDGYFVELEGSMDEKSLAGLVHIKPSANPDNDGDVDKYWLDSSLKDQKKLESIWNELQIDEVNIGVKIDVTKIFSLRLPAEIKDKIVATQKLLHAGSRGDRNLLIKAMLDYRQQERRSHSSPNDFVRVIQSLVAKETLLEHISIDRGYNIGDVNNPELYDGIIPTDIRVNTFTTLTLSRPQAMGYLRLNRKSYLDEISKSFNKILKTNKKSS